MDSILNIKINMKIESRETRGISYQKLGYQFTADLIKLKASFRLITSRRVFRQNLMRKKTKI